MFGKIVRIDATLTHFRKLIFLNDQSSRLSMFRRQVKIAIPTSVYPPLSLPPPLGAQHVVATRAGKCNKGWFGRGRSSARLERRPVTSEVVGSNPIGPAKIIRFGAPLWAAVRGKCHEIEADRTNPQHLARERVARPQLGADRCKRASARTSRVARGKPADRQDRPELHSQPGYR